MLTITNILNLIACVNIIVAIPVEKYLLDSTQSQSELNWDKEAYGESHELPGWKEQSFSQKSGDVWRVHFVCDIASSNPNNWLRTPYIRTEDANRLTIRIEYTIRECKKYPGEIRSCKETFQLLYAESNDPTESAPTFSESNYKYLKTIAPNANYENSTQSQKPTSSIYRMDVDVSVVSKGIYFAFRDHGACVSLLSVRVYFSLCPSQIKDLVVYPKTPTGANSTDLVQRKAYCIDNAHEKYTPIGWCQANGNWFIPSGSETICECKEGYFFNSFKCLACPQGTYKTHIGNSQTCLSCPLNAWSSSSASTQCTCNQGYYRLQPLNYTTPCILYPSEPKNLTVFYLDQATIKLRWNTIVNQDDYEPNTIKYIVNCTKCLNSSTRRCVRRVPCEAYVRYKQELYENQIIFKSLDSNTQYIIEIYARHTQNLFKTKTVDISIRTSKDLLAYEIHNLTAYFISASNLLLKWYITSFDVNKIRSYEIRYWPKGDEYDVKVITLNEKYIDSHIISELNDAKSYFIQLRAQIDNVGWSAFSVPIESEAKSQEILMTKSILALDTTLQTNNTSNLSTYVALIIVVAFCLVAGLLTLILLRNNRSSKKCVSKATASDCDTLDFAKSYNPLGTTSSGGSSPMWPPLNTPKTYIDPHTYEDPTKAVREFARELQPSHIIIESVIGGGEFGDVCKGYLKIYNGVSASQFVAIKTLKGAATEQNRCDFLTEASIMAQFNDPNVIRLEGVVTKSLPLMIVTEFMENGSLDTFLRLNESKLQTIQLVKMLKDVASGMRYLCEMNYIHRDLAARNILINKDLVCKVADFGLSREIEQESSTEGAYTTKGGKIPIRWTAPEAIVYRKFTCSSDVWSFGILAWEVLSYGERPYWNWSNQDVIKAVEKGYRLSPPQNCPDCMYQLLGKCWQADRHVRPKFNEIVLMLDELTRYPEGILNMAQQRELLPFNPNKPTYIQLTSTRDFLQQIKLEHYLGNFEKLNLLNLSNLFHLEARDLAFSLAINSKIDQNIILDSLASIRTHFQSYYNDYVSNQDTSTTTTTITTTTNLKTNQGFLV